MYVIEVGGDPSSACLLLVEDNPADARLTAKALGGAGWAGRLLVAPSGQDALAVLFREGAYASAPRPQLVLLDLNMPGLSGREVLDAVRSSPGLDRLPVIVLSTSADRRDVEDAYARRANAYVTKPMAYARLEGVVRMLTGFWLEAAELPR